jgi:hypothetical protein
MSFTSVRCRCPQQVTKVKLEQKQREGIAEARSGRRSLVRPGLLDAACRLICLPPGGSVWYRSAGQSEKGCRPPLLPTCCAGERAGLRVCWDPVRRGRPVVGRPMPLEGAWPAAGLLHDGLLL